MPHTPQELSVEAMNDLRAIYEEEFDEVLTDDELQEMGMRLLRFFSILMTQESGPTSIQPTEYEQKALDFISAEAEQGRTTSVRQLARAMGLKSSRSGQKLMTRLKEKGWIKIRQ